MPELPEAEHTRGVLQRTLAGRRIAEVEVAEDPIVYDGVPTAQVEEWLVGREVAETHRRGKYLWLELSEAPHLIVHLGMTGTVRTRGDEPLNLESSPKHPDHSWPPRFTKLRLVTTDGDEVAYTNARRLGRLLFRGDPANERPIAKLGFDPLTDMPGREAFAQRIGRRSRAVLKALLLDQGFSAGVGNWIADEVLYQARIDPQRRAGTLSEQEVETLRKTIRRVVLTAVKADARKDRFPKGWLFHRRWGKKEDATTADGEPIAFVEIGGRTTAWVPGVQR
ncbi:MAG: DNA-formamidopyrimidine glycosylase family protein [Myxococcota bacterium]